MIRYIPGLDGLRAIAVVAVIAYHLDLPWAPGGFLGVDLFFVISGYLITALLVAEADRTGRIGLRDFWVRRFRRLVPAVVVMVAAVVAATRWWGVPEQWNGVRADAAASLGYVANWRFVIAEQSYFDSLLGPSPLRHMWSLAVEEQWYLLWPLVIAGLGATAMIRRRRRAAIALGLVSVAIASAVWMAILFDPTDPSRAYYGTDTRAQQLLVGAALAVGLPLVPRTSRWLAHRSVLATSLGAFVVIVATTSDDAAWLYHGGFFAVSVLCAIALVGVAVPTRSISSLESTPMVWLGKRSYSLYLWHWPVIVFVGAPIGLDATGLPLAATQVVVSLVLAEASYRWVESPVRHSTRSPSRLLAGWSAGAAACALGALVFLIAPADRRQFSETVIRPSELPTAVGTGSETADATDEPAPSRRAATESDHPTDVSVTPVTQGAAELSGTSDLLAVDAAAGGPAPDEPIQRSLLLVGDSTALVASLTKPEVPDWRIESYARLGCAITSQVTIDADSDEENGHDPACSAWRDDWASSAAIVQPDVAVIMVGAWEVLDHVVDGTRHSFPTPEWEEVVYAALRDGIGAVGDQRPVVLLTLPCMEQVDNRMFRAVARNDPQRIAAFNRILRTVAAERTGVSVAALDELLCDDGTSRTGDGGPLRYDGVHLTPEGIEVFWSWLIGELEPVLDTLRSSNATATPPPAGRPQ